MATTRWTKEQLKLAFHLYCQLPFGKLDMRTPEVIKLAGLIGRTPGAVAMKLSNSFQKTSQVKLARPLQNSASNKPFSAVQC